MMLSFQLLMDVSGLSSHKRLKLPIGPPRIQGGTNKSCKRSCSGVRFCLAGRSKSCAAGGNDREENQVNWPGGLDPELMPNHIAFIMDGNRRWARNRGYPLQVGHRAGAESLKRLCISCRKFGVKVLSVFAFSTENWTRSKEEVEYLMKLFEEIIRPRTESKERTDGRLTVVGNRSRLPESLQMLISSAEEVNKEKKGPHLMMALNYSGCQDITESAKTIAAKVRDGVLQVDDIDETVFEQHLQTNGVEYPNPDLMIRTSGELRLSNFMLWQMANTQLFFTHKLFPDFDEADLIEAIASYQQRQTSSQRAES